MVCYGSPRSSLRGQRHEAVQRRLQVLWISGWFRSAQPGVSGEAVVKKDKDPVCKTSDESTADLKKTQRLFKKKVKDKKMEEDKNHRIKLSKDSTFLPMGQSKKATVTEELVAGLQNALGGPDVNATTKCRQELDNLEKHLSVLLKIHESGQKLLRDTTDDEDKGWSQHRQSLSRVTISTQNEIIPACTTKLEQLLQQEDVIAEKNHKKKRAVSGKGNQRKDDSEDEDGKQNKDDSEDEDDSPVKRRKENKDHKKKCDVSDKGKKRKDDSEDEDGKQRKDDSEDEDDSPVKCRKKSKDDSEDEDNVDSESGSESVTVVSDDDEEEEEEDLW